jgi:hypothetical protein
VRVPRAKPGDVLTIRAMVDTGAYQGKIVKVMPYTVTTDREILPPDAVEGAAG